MEYKTDKEVLETFIDTSFNAIDIDKALTLVSDDIKWISTTNDAYNKKELRILLEKNNYKNVIIKEISSNNISDTFTIFNIELHSNKIIKGTICIIKDNDKWLINNVHLSLSNHIYDIQSNNLLNAIPGGIGIFVFGEIIRCNYYSDGFAKIAGLTRKEMDQRIKDNLVLSSIIAPIDFPYVSDILTKNTALGLPLNMNYRYKCAKDNSIKWLHLTAQKMGEEDGYPVYYCVFTTPSQETTLYKDIADDSSNGVIVFEYKNKNILYVNKTAYNCYGLFDTNNNLSESLTKAFNNKQIRYFLNDNDVKSLQKDKYTVFNIERDNQYYTIKAKLLLWQGHKAYVLYISNDTNEHKKEIELQNLLNQIPTGISSFKVDDEGINQTFVNYGYYKTLGISPLEYEKYRGYNVLNAVSSKDIEHINEVVEELKNGSDSCDFVYQPDFPGHDNIWIRLIGRVAYRDNNSFILYAGFIDVSKEISYQIRREELFNAIPSGILEFYAKGSEAKIISANKTLMEMIGYDEDDFANKKTWELSTIVHPEDYHLLVEARENIEIGKGKTYDFRLLNEKTGIYRWISCDYTITKRTNNGVRVISAFLDIEDKRRAEDASAAKSRFLSRMSHEIRTPINAIMGIAELEKQDIINNNVSIENIRKYSKETYVASNYLLTLVNDILDTSRIENNQIEIKQHPVNVEQYLKDIKTLVAPLVKEKNINFICNRKTRTHEVYIGDGIRVKQIIVNLLNNAFKFTPPKGTVSLICEAINETKDTTTLQFTVSDNGIGISKDFQDKLFTPFVQEDCDNTSPFSGTGLGLSIAKSLANKMGGDITCFSVKGKGTTFVATVVVGNVIEEDEIKTTTGLKLSNDEIEFDGVRILVCEDHPLNQRITKALLERKKCIVEIANDGAIGVDMFNNSPVGYYSMILMDIRMPNMDGLQATSMIRKLDRSDAKTIPIVAMSANAYDEDINKSLSVGMNEHLAKPVDAIKLYRTIATFTRKIELDSEKLTVLVVDDIEVNRLVIVETLRNEYHVLEAINGLDALKVLENNKNIIAVITDLQMPIMNGTDLIKNIRKEYRYEDMAILVNTQYGDSQQETELLGLGVDDFIYKPTSPNTLAVRLKNVLARRRYIL